MINVILAEDMPLIREGLISLIKHEEGIKLLDYAEDGEAVVRLVEERKNEVQVVVMDLNMPKQDGLEASKQIKARFPGIGIVILTTHKEKIHINQALKIGVEGYILKDDVYSELLYAIGEVASGKEYFGKEPAQISRDIVRNGLGEEKILSKRQIEIVYRLAKGLSTDEIADKLFLASATVHTHRRNIIKKVGVKNTPELIAWAIVNGLIDPYGPPPE